MTQSPPLLTRVRSAVRTFVARIEFHHAISILFALSAIALALAPNTGTMGYMLNRYGMHADWLSLALSASAVIIAFRPSLRLFILAQIPLAVYTLFSALYVASTSTFSAVTTVYLIGTIALMIWLYAGGTIGQVRFAHVLSMFLALLGMAIIDNPDRGTAAYIYTHYAIPGETMGLLLMIAALSIAFRPKAITVQYATYPLVLYLFSSFLYTLLNVDRAGFAALVISGMFVYSVVYMLMHRSDLFCKPDRARSDGTR